MLGPLKRRSTRPTKKHQIKTHPNATIHTFKIYINYLSFKKTFTFNKPLTYLFSRHLFTIKDIQSHLSLLKFKLKRKYKENGDKAR